MPPAVAVRLKRSRALWEQTRSVEENDGRWNVYNLLRAILYELQPIRFSQLSKFHETAWTNLSVLGKHIRTTIPRIFQWTWNLIKGMTIKQWLIVVGAIIYYGFLRWIHSVLEAGPLVIIVTALVIIFTIGLNDEKSDDGSLSAYSVFNKGFQKIMGSIDEDSLLQQHIGGGGLGFLAAAAAAPRQQQEPLPQNDPVPFRRRQQQLPELLDDQVENNNNNNNDQQDALQQQEINRSRKSGKKARRGNLEQRREIRRQREAALAMGFDGDHDQMAMNRLLDDTPVIIADGNPIE